MKNKVKPLPPKLTKAFYTMFRQIVQLIPEKMIPPQLLIIKDTENRNEVSGASSLLLKCEDTVK